MFETLLDRRAISQALRRQWHCGFRRSLGKQFNFLASAPAAIGCPFSLKENDFMESSLLEI
jgi:hypothetical protein